MGKMQSARAGACSVALSEGRVLITGGQSAQGALNSVECSMAPAHSFWWRLCLRFISTMLALPSRTGVSGRRRHGERRRGSSVSEIYDPVANTWTITGPMTVSRSGASASVLKSGRVLIAGGESNGTVLATLETFDPVNNVFAPVFDSMSAARKIMPRPF